jgi:hypothetical protein
MRAGERLARQGLDQGSGWRNWSGCLRSVAMIVIVIFQIFEDIADIQKRVAIQPDIYERRLHTGEHAGYAALVDAADQRELFFALDVNFD